VKSHETRPARREKRLARVAATALIALLVIAVVLVVSRHGRRSTVGAGNESAVSDGARPRAPLPSLGTDPSPSARSPSVTAAEPTSEQVASVIKSWHAAIVTKNAETVETLDREFAARPGEFVAALIDNAQSDSEERVRSFSTRVLGKLRRPESVEALRQLCKDSSQYVRFNAVWALGELNDRDAVATLRRLERHDPSSMVRQSAGESRRKIEGT
jgi:HEAT repeat protein